MLADHLGDPWNPRLFAIGLPMHGRQVGRGLRVVERVMRPDSEIMIGDGNCDSFRVASAGRNATQRFNTRYAWFR